MTIADIIICCLYVFSISMLIYILSEIVFLFSVEFNWRLFAQILCIVKTFSYMLGMGSFFLYVLIEMIMLFL